MTIFLLAILHIYTNFEKNVLGLVFWSQEKSNKTWSTVEPRQLNPAEAGQLMLTLYLPQQVSQMNICL